MRELKFRAWHKRDKKMLQVADISWGNHGEVEFRLECDEHYYGDAEIELMQFTGLHDKNGKEIYEGDLVRILYESGHLMYEAFEVKWEVGSSRWDYFGVGFELDPEEMSRTEVIGNVHERKE